MTAVSADMEASGKDVPWWTLDISRLRPLTRLINALNTPNLAAWTEKILEAIHVLDVSERVLHLAAPFADRARIVGVPMLNVWPAESRDIVAQLILAVASDSPGAPPRRQKVCSLFFDDPVVSVWGEEEGGQHDVLFLSVHGRLIDDRSLWAVRSSEERYRNLTQHLPCALLLVDSRRMLTIFDELRRDGVSDIASYLETEPGMVMHSRDIVRVTDANLKAVQLFEAEDAAQLLGPVDFVFQASPQTANSVIKGHFEKWRIYAEIMKIRTFKGRIRDVALTVTYPTPPEWLDVTFLSFEDITERLRTEAQLRQIQADYSRASRISTLGEFTTSIAHEINQPLSAIVTNAETSLRWLSRHDIDLGKVRQLTTRIAQSGRHASNIVQRIRSMATRRAPKHIALNLNEVVDESLLFVRHDIEARSIALIMNLDHQVPHILGDRVELQQVIVNLLVNALQAMSALPEGRIEVATGLDPAGMVFFSIRDHGSGVPQDDLERVFAGFFTTKEGGIGIGLSICQSIVHAHDGLIDVDNHPDGGAVFQFRLPAAGDRLGSDTNLVIKE